MLFIILSLFLLFTSQTLAVNSYYYRVSYRNIQCITAPCPNYQLSKLNVNGSSVLVENLVFPNGLEQNFLTLFESNTAIFYGYLTANRNGYNVNDFTVVRAYKQLPQSNNATSTDKYYTFADNGVRCITTPCFSTDAILLNTNTANTPVAEIYQPYSTNVGHFDANWLNARVFDDATHRSIGLGSFDQNGKIVLSSVFVRLPDPKTTCPALPLLKCAGGFTTVYERDSSRCLSNPHCTTESGACALYIPSCSEGYRLVSYPGGNFGCPVYYCDSIYISQTY